MKGEVKCYKCGNTGIKADMTPCDCEYSKITDLPYIAEIPSQYQNAQFSKDLLPDYIDKSYGYKLESLLNDIKNNLYECRNIIICSPPNTGKTIFAYTVYSYLYSKGIKMPPIIDILEVRRHMNSVYQTDELSAIKNSLLAIFKIPLDVPTRFAENILSILDMRVTSGSSTIFLFSGTEQDLLSLDKFEKFKYLIGDGSYHSLRVISYSIKREVEVEY